ncbi:glycerol acyltransferase [Knoellia sinensis KCTC 19936]|uniref:Glycerol acyltransferase n=1 Tax=Knoellia sinensis KCTC 19936 TaxID=1385520 RepID=A0A0A0JF95_9MICO|nr:lysophospholipid acyltransferase family protein [Knoellia sinensis]KGN34737.1 glycerol acyltransferase [Knoellia sinensis KCTC 19936]
MEPVYTPVVTFARGVFAAQGLKFRIEGEDNVPRTGGAVMAINHTGYFDFTYAGLAALKHKRLVRFMAKQSIFSHRVAGPLMRGMKHIPVDRKDGRASFNRAVQALKDGEIVGVFPEATMSRSFELKEFKPGAVRMAQEAGVPILPTTLWGSQRVWSKNVPKHMGRSKIPVFITVGEPIHVAPDANRAEATAELQAVMQAQLDAQQAAYPPLTGDDLIYQPARLGGTAPTPEEAAAHDHHDMTRTVDKFNKSRKS